MRTYDKYEELKKAQAAEIKEKWKKVAAVSVEVTMENFADDGGFFESLDEFREFFEGAALMAAESHPEWFEGEGE